MSLFKLVGIENTSETMIFLCKRVKTGDSDPYNFLSPLFPIRDNGVKIRIRKVPFDKVYRPQFAETEAIGSWFLTLVSRAFAGTHYFHSFVVTKIRLG